jgi:hypothetical protein
MPLGRAVSGAYGWIVLWNTATVANGSYTIRSVATGASGGSHESAGVRVTVEN